MSNATASVSLSVLKVRLEVSPQLTLLSAELVLALLSI